MEKYTIEKDIKVFYIEAESFPDGVQAAYEKFHALVPYSERRRYFSFSRPEHGVIVYKIGAEEIEEGEGEKFNCKEFVIQKGKYISTIIKEYKKDIPEIGKVFQKLIHSPGIDPKGYCVEWYINFDDVMCMVRLEE